jgi:hypothetical protein
MNQTLALVTSQMSALATEQAVTSTEATGGVCWPTPRLSVTRSSQVVTVRYELQRGGNQMLRIFQA